MGNTWIFWLIITMALVLVEVCTVNVICIWFALGSLAAMLVSLLPAAPLWTQIVTFVCVSVAMLLVARRFFLKHLKKKPVATNVDQLIGKIALVTEPINNDLAQGRVSIDGLLWSARTLDGDEVGEGEKVEVLSIEGVKLIVKKTN